MVCWVYSLESPRWGYSNEYTQHKFSYWKEHFLTFLPWAIGRTFQGIKNEFELGMVNEQSMFELLRFNCTSLCSTVPIDSICRQWRSLSAGWSGLHCPHMPESQLAFYVKLHRAVIGPSATLTGRWRPDIDLRRMLTGNAWWTLLFLWKNKKNWYPLIHSFVSRGISTI